MITVDMKAGRALVSEQLFSRLVRRVVQHEGFGYSYAERIMDQTLAFLGTCGKSAEKLSPSKPVDVGWHTFILYTREYRKFCYQVAGGAIDHEPHDTPETKANYGYSQLIEATMTAMRNAGYSVDEELWTGEIAGRCSSGDDGCGGSGEDGNENQDANYPDKRKG